MNITIENNILDEVGLSKSEILIELAVAFYKRGVLSIGQASNLAGVKQIEFRRELGKRDESINYNIEDLQEDLTALKNLKKK
jgi:predicted HTH domain antitoxin